MLPRTNKVGKRQFPSPTAPGRGFASPLFSGRVTPLADGTAPARYAVVVSKKVAKSAVARNTIRRRMFAAIRVQQGLAKHGFTLVLYMRNASVAAPYRTLEDAVAEVLRKNT